MPARIARVVSGLSTEEAQRLVSVPLEFGLSGMLNLQAMRSISARLGRLQAPLPRSA